MKTKKTRRTKGCVLFLAGALGLCFAATGCQATPEAQAVVQKDGALASVSASAESGQVPSASASWEAGALADYAVLTHWKENYTPSGQVTISVDADVSAPQGVTCPIVKFEAAEISQDKLNEIASALVEDGASLYQLPIPQTKAALEAELMRMRQRASEARAQGAPAEEIAAAEESVSQLEQQYEQAPEGQEPQAGDTTYTFIRDYVTGEPVEARGENFVAVAGTDSSGINFELRATRKTENGETGGVSFSQGGVLTRSEDETNERYAQSGGDAPDEERTARLARYDQNSIDLEGAKRLARDFLTSIGIGDRVVVSSEPALWSPDKESLASGNAFLSNETGEGYTEDAVAVRFARSISGLPTLATEDMDSGSAEGTPAYSSPLCTESGTIVFDKDGAIRGFSWNDPVAEVETVAPSCEILSFEDITERLVDQLYWGNLIWVEGDDDASVQLDASDIRLITTLINAKDEPNRALAIPAWSVDVTKTLGDGTYLGTGTIFMSALDGSPILAPGTTVGA